MLRNSHNLARRTAVTSAFPRLGLKRNCKLEHMPMPSSDLAQDLDAMARDFAAMVNAGRDSSDRRVGIAQEGSGLFARQPVGASVREFPRPSRPADISDRYRSNQAASGRPWLGRLKSRAHAGFFKAALPTVMNSLQRLRPKTHSLDIPLRTVASVFLAVLIGVGALFAWQSYGISTTKSPNVTAEQAISTRSGQVSAATPQSVPVIQTEPPAAATPSPELVLQLEAMVRDLAVLRDSLAQLTAKQEQTSQKVVTLEAIAAKQEQMTQKIAALQALAAKQEQMAQDITMLQAVDEDIGQRLSSPPPSQAVPLPRSKKPPKQSTAQSTSAPHLAPVGLPFLQGSP
jgi:hypothetical protein